ncbi:uncharacterized protein LOC110989353 [Acanthaster planci]|uniref:Uncharacterized protein LOC110989353 n=1 Tax=Acanthaster planci TaxID=133434 RepID=A0A8B7ZUY5_ACAPL|nr:uncharacterized protein LOC110989353 [Acanthaster planci]
MEGKVKSELVVVSTPVNSPNLGPISTTTTVANTTQGVPHSASSSASTQFAHLPGFDFSTVRPPFPSPGGNGSNLGHGSVTVQSLLQQQAHLLQLQQAHQLHELQQQQQQQQRHVTVGPELPSPGGPSQHGQVPPPHIGYPGMQGHAVANMLPMPSAHQLTLASQLARLRPGMMPGLGGQDLAGPGASLAAAAAAASLGLPFGLPHPHGLPLPTLGLGLQGMAPNPDRQGIMAGFGITTQQQQTQANSSNFPSTFPSIPPPLLSPDYPTDMIQPDAFGSLGIIPVAANPTGQCSQGDMTGSDCSDRSGMTWLDAAQVILEEAGCPLHIKDIKQRILDRGLVQSNAKSSLEAVLYRDTQRGSRRFKRVEGQNGVFRIMTAEDRVKKRSKPVHSTSRKRVTSTAKDTEALQSLLYKAKYRKLRKLIKLMIFENAALNDEVCRIEQKVERAQQERFFLLQRVLHYREICDIPPSASKATPSSRRLVSRRHGTGEDGDGHLSSLGSLNKREKAEKANKTKRKHKKPKKTEKEKPRKDAVRSKTKRSSGMSTKRLVQQIPLDSTGRPVFPIKLSSLTVHSLGQIVTDRSGYHDEHCIYPSGFCSSRTYTSAKDPNVLCLYTCKVLDAGQKPRFEIVAEDEPDHPFVGSSPTECHNNLLDDGKEIENAKGKGTDFFGLTHPTIQNLIQSSPGARKCLKYKWMKFTTTRSPLDHRVEGQTKHKARDPGKKNRREGSSSVKKHDQSNTKQDPDSRYVLASADPLSPMTSSGDSLNYQLTSPVDTFPTETRAKTKPSEESSSTTQTRSKPTLTKEDSKLSTMQTRSKPTSGPTNQAKPDSQTQTKTKPDLLTQTKTKPDLPIQTKTKPDLPSTRVHTRSNLPNQVQTRSKPLHPHSGIKTESQGDQIEKSSQ